MEIILRVFALFLAGNIVWFLCRMYWVPIPVPWAPVPSERESSWRKIQAGGQGVPRDQQTVWVESRTMLLNPNNISTGPKKINSL